MSEDPIGTALGIVSEEKQTNTEITSAQTRAITAANSSNNQLQNDYEFARQNLYDLLTKGAAALDELSEIARQSQHPRSYEVLATLIKNLSEVNDKILIIHKNVKSLEDHPSDEGSTSPITVSNAIFVGTTTELLQLTKKKN